jgi:hypothetical protein
MYDRQAPRLAAEMELLTDRDTAATGGRQLVTSRITAGLTGSWGPAVLW